MTTMQLRRLNEKIPGICTGPDSPRLPFRRFGEQLQRELAWLKRHPCRIDFGKFFPWDLLLLFPPGHRENVLAGGEVSPAAWRRGAAIRMLQLVTGTNPPYDRRAFEEWVARDRGRAGIRGAFLDIFRDASAAFDLTGKIFHSESELLSLAGRGSTSTVYEGLFRGERCAVKLPAAGAEKRFEKESALWASLGRTPFLPAVRAISFGAAPCCIMEFCRTGPCVWDPALRERFMAALDFLHRRGLLHGDLRRSNLGLGADGRPLLLDLSHAHRPPRKEFAAACAREKEKLYNLLTKGADDYERNFLSCHVSGAGQTVA